MPYPPYYRKSGTITTPIHSCSSRMPFLRRTLAWSIFLLIQRLLLSCVVGYWLLYCMYSMSLPVLIPTHHLLLCLDFFLSWLPLLGPGRRILYKVLLHLYSLQKASLHFLLYYTEKYSCLKLYHPYTFQEYIPCCHYLLLLVLCVLLNLQIYCVHIRSLCTVDCCHLPLHTLSALLLLPGIFSIRSVNASRKAYMPLLGYFLIWKPQALPYLSAVLIYCLRLLSETSLPLFFFFFFFLYMSAVSACDLML